jgi:D-xylulose reductase
MRAVVLEKAGELSLREIEIQETVGPRDVCIAVRNVGICGSDVHYYQHGAIGSFVVREPMVLGHEAAGVITEVGAEVTGLEVGDRVCMEPGIPDPTSRASRLGMYNLDPAVRFWATPPIHGVLRGSVVHPADFTFRLPDNVSLAEGAMVEPLAVGMHAANKAQIRPGDVAVVTGAGTIGLMAVLAALAGGCSQVIVSDVVQPKLDIAAALGPVIPVNVAKGSGGQESLAQVVRNLTAGWGADVVFEASGSEAAASGVFDLICPGGRVVFIGMPGGPIRYDVVAAQVKEARVEHVFRYAHVYPRALALMGSGKIDVKPMITDTFAFEDSVAAFEFAAHMPPTSVKVQIEIAAHRKLMYV